MKQTMKQMVTSHIRYMLRDMWESGIKFRDGHCQEEKCFFVYRGRTYRVDITEVKK